MSDIRRNWAPPVRYLKKRGYMDNHWQTSINKDIDLPAVDDVSMGQPYRTHKLFRDTSAGNSDSLTHSEDDPYIGEKFIQSMKEKWNRLWHNGTTTSAPNDDSTTIANTNTTAEQSSTEQTLTDAKQQIQSTWLVGEVNENFVEEASFLNDVSTANNNVMSNISAADVDYLRKMINCSSANTNITTNALNGTAKGMNNFKRQQH